jgi:HEAT repeat protein
VPVTMEQVLAQLYPDEPDYEQAAQLGPEALPHLVQLVEKGDPALASKATYLASVINAEQTAEIVEKAARNPDPVVRVAAAASLGNLEEMPTPLVESMLNDGDVGVRKLALRSLETQKPTGFKPMVQEIAEGDPNMSLRQIASRVANELP